MSTANACNTSAICDHAPLIRRQFVKIEALESELAAVRLERDSLLVENEKLCFQFQMLSEALKQHNTTTTTTSTSMITSNEQNNAKTISHKTQSGVTIASTDSTSITLSDNSVRAVITSSGAQNRELSQRMVDASVAIIERKYGGSGARVAAVTIQRAWRTYRLRKRFKSIAIAAFNATNQHSLSKRVSQQQQQSRSSVITSASIASSNDSSSADSNSTAVQTTSAAQSELGISSDMGNSTTVAFESARKRRYRVGLNLLNKTPAERGIRFLIANSFIDGCLDNNSDTLAANIAHFLLTRKGVSKTTIGEYISTNNSFNATVLKYFSREIDLTSLEVDAALRRFQTYFRFPGEAQKIERLVDAFADRYIECNPESNNQPLTRDHVFILSFAIIMLNTDLHVPALKDSKRMTCGQWKANLRGVFGPIIPNDAMTTHGGNGTVSDEYLTAIYERIKANELRTGPDHVTQVLKVQNAVIGKDVPSLALPHRRLVCYCRLYEVRDLSKKERHGQHQREVFLFNDLLLITKLTARAKSNHVAEYQFRQAIPLDGLAVSCFTSPNHRFGIRLSRRVDDRIVILMNARNDLDRSRFVDDLSESIAEMNEMESLRIARGSAQQAHGVIGGVNSAVITKSSSLLALYSSPLTHNNTSSSQHTTSSSSSSTVTTTTSTSNSSSTTSSVSSVPVRRMSSGSLDSGLSLSRDASPQQQKSMTTTTKC